VALAILVSGGRIPANGATAGALDGSSGSPDSWSAWSEKTPLDSISALAGATQAAATAQVMIPTTMAPGMTPGTMTPGTMTPGSVPPGSVASRQNNPKTGLAIRRSIASSAVAPTDLSAGSAAVEAFPIRVQGNRVNGGKAAETRLPVIGRREVPLGSSGRGQGLPVAGSSGAGAAVPSGVRSHGRGLG
jgi:hypothetical protein